MYRIYGIPSRYAVGFRVTPDLFEEQEDGRYKAVLTDEQAHAWAEIYFDGEGWLPVETTPAAGTQSAGMDGENGDYMPDTEAAAGASGAENGIGREDESNQGNQDVPDQAEYGEEPGKEESADETENRKKDGDDGQKEQPGGSTNENRKHNVPERIRTFFIRMAPVFAVAAGIIFVWLMISLRRYIILRRQEKYGAGQIMVRMLEVLGMTGEIRDCDPIDPMGADFPERLSGMVPAITKMEAGQIQRAALQESFGNEALSGMQGREARRVYKKACSYVYGGLPWYKKIYFRYGKVYR